MPRRRKKKDNKSRVFSIIALVFLLAVLWVWKSMEAHRLSREMTSLENRKVELVENNKHLKAELSKLRSIAYVDSCVRHKYGMTYDVKTRTILFDKQRTEAKSNRSMMVHVFDAVEGFIRRIFE